MAPCFGRTALLRISAVALLAMLFPLARAFSQGESPTTAASHTANQGAATLLPIGRAVLAAALAAEERVNSRGTFASISFPLPMCGFAGGLCGAVNRDGTVAVAPTFDWVDRFYEGRALVRSGGLYGYVDTTGRIISRPQYEIAGAYSRGFAQVDDAGKSGLLDLEGQTVVEPRFGFVVPFTADRFWVTHERVISDGAPGTEQFSNGFLRPVTIGDRAKTIWPRGGWGLIDRAGSWIREPMFSQIRIFDRSDNSLMWAKTDAGWGVIKADGSWLVEPKFEAVTQFFDGLAPVRLTGKWGYIDRNGLIVIAPQFILQGPLKAAGFAKAKVGKFFGLIDRSGAWVIEPKFDAIFPRRHLLPRSWWMAEVVQNTVSSMRRGGRYSARNSETLLRGNVCSWTNFWRIDDPIGNRVDVVNSGFISNRVLGCGGHVNYWREDEVRRRILALLESTPGSSTRFPSEPMATGDVI